MKQRGYQLSRWSMVGLIVWLGVMLLIFPWTRSVLVSSFNHTGRWLGQIRNWGHMSDRAVEQNVEQLRKMNEALTLQVSTLKAGLETSQSLERIEQFLSSSRRPGIAAAIVGYSDDPGINTFTISIERSGNIQVGMPVVTDRGTYVGKIIQVRESIAIVRALRDSQSRVLGRVQNEKKSQGIIQGQRGTSLQMSFIPKDDLISVGDVIETSGSEELIPPGIPIGTAATLETHPGDVFQTISVYSPIRISELTAVAVLRSL